MKVVDAIARIFPGDPAIMAYVDASQREGRHKEFARMQQAEHFEHVNSCAQCQSAQGADGRCQMGQRLAAASHSVSDPWPAFLMLGDLRRYYELSPDPTMHDGKLKRFGRNPVFAWRAVDLCAEWAIPFPTWVTEFLSEVRHKPGRIPTKKQSEDASVLELAVEAASKSFSWEEWGTHEEVPRLQAEAIAALESNMKEAGLSADLARRIGPLGRALMEAWAKHADFMISKP